MNIQQQKKYHERKLAIIELIELCDEYISREEKNSSQYSYAIMRNISLRNINRYTEIKTYLLTRYNN